MSLISEERFGSTGKDLSANLSAGFALEVSGGESCGNRDNLGMKECPPLVRSAPIRLRATVTD